MRLLSASLFAACLFSAASGAQAGVVFSSGSLPDLTDAASFTLSDDLIVSGSSWNHTVLPGALPAPVTVRAVEFYGYSDGLGVLGGDPDHAFELVLGGGVTVLDVERTSVGPPLGVAPLGGFVTDVQRIRIDIQPTTFSGGQVLIRGAGGPGADFFMARADPAIADIQLDEYSDTNLTTIVATTVGDAFYFNFYDEFLLAPAPGDYDGDGAVDAADYTVWRSGFGSTSSLDADGNGDGVVDAADYTVWRDNATLPSPVPEPIGAALATVGAWLALLTGRRVGG